MILSLTRLRVRRWRDLPRFLATSRACIDQAAADLACLGGATYIGPGLTFWTATLWLNEEAAQNYVRTPPHLPAMKYLQEWCSEAATAHLTVDRAELPDRRKVVALLSASPRFFPVKVASVPHASGVIPRKGPFRTYLFKPIKPAARP